jgi:hypothetical protein
MIDLPADQLVQLPVGELAVHVLRDLLGADALSTDRLHYLRRFPVEAFVGREPSALAARRLRASFLLGA